VIVLHRKKRQTCLREIGFGIVERDLKLLGIDAKQNLTRSYVLALMHIHGPDKSRPIGQNHQLRDMNVRVVGSTVASADKQESKRTQRNGGTAADHQYAAQ